MVDWKKEVNLSDLFGRKEKDDESPAEAPTPAPEAQAAPEPQPVEPVQPPLAAAPAVPALSSPPAETPLPDPPVEPAAETVELPGAPPLAAPEEPVSQPPLAAEPAAASEQPASSLPPLSSPPTSAAPGSVSAPPPLIAPPAAPAPPAPAPGIHPPVPAAQLPSVKPEEKKGSFLKKELSFGRKKKDKEPKAERAPKSGGKPKREKQPKPIKADSSGGKRAKRLVGLKIGASQLAAARVVNNGSPELVQVAREDLERGVIVGGELREPDLLAAALKDFFRTHKLPRQNVRLGIANNRIGVRVFEIAGVDDPKQLENAIRYRAQEVLPIPMEEAVLDYQVLGETVDAEGTRTRRILLVVAYRDLVERYVAACKKAGIKLAGIDLEAFALLRALAVPRADSDPPAQAALVVVSIGHDRSTFAVSDGRTCEFTRVLDWGGNALDVALARTLDVTPSEAEPVKRALSLGDHAPLVEGLTEDQSRAAREAVRGQLQAFARELVSSLQFYQNQPDSLGIGEIVLTGGTAHLEGLSAELQKLIGVQVRIGDPLIRVNVGKKIKDREQIGSLAVAIGLGIED
jgi:type IV pilus assembly protein PilM